LAHLISGKVDALETDLLPRYDLFDAWYRLLNCGYRVPLVGGSSRASNAGALGAVRTFARLAPGEELSYRAWIEAVRAGRVFVSNGPLLSLTVDGQGPGAVLDLPAEGGTVRVRAEVRSSVPVRRLEVVAGGSVVADTLSSRAELEIDLPVSVSGWLAARCHGDAEVLGGVGPQHACAHTAPVYLQVAGCPLRPDPQAVASVVAELDRLLPWAEGEGVFANEDQRRHYGVIVQAARGELLRRQGELDNS
ncbi:MAG TPA: CehA/McbA family metallohydrolase, partial [Gemmataceae bacterium]|nr:CehA/McbA family metallohydrolase [Gemmataceae bacterium]